MNGAMLKIDVTTDKTEYAKGEPITLSLRVENVSSEPVTLRFASGQRYDFSITDRAGKVAWRWSAGRGFIQMLGQERLEPGDALSYEERYDGELAPGSYTVAGALVASNQRLEARVTIAIE